METKPYGIIYLIQNKVNGKNYVGQTSWDTKFDIHNNYRIKKHKSESMKENPECLIDKKIKQYGYDNFNVYHIDTCYTNQTDLNALECFYIEKFNSKVVDGCGYNIKEGGGNGKHSEETKIKISTAGKGRICSPATKERIGLLNRGKKLSDEQKKKISDTRLKKKIGVGESNYNFGKKLSDEQKKKISDTKKANKSSVGSNNPMFGKVGKLNKNSKPIMCIETSQCYESIRQASKIIGIEKSNISAQILGKRKSAGGFHFRFI